MRRAGTCFTVSFCTYAPPAPRMFHWIPPLTCLAFRIAHAPCCVAPLCWDLCAAWNGCSLHRVHNAAFLAAILYCPSLLLYLASVVATRSAFHACAAPSCMMLPAGSLTRASLPQLIPLLLPLVAVPLPALLLRRSCLCLYFAAVVLLSASGFLPRNMDRHTFIFASRTRSSPLLPRRA